jgi:hypothetical protein
MWWWVWHDILLDSGLFHIIIILYRLCPVLRRIFFELRLPVNRLILFLRSFLVIATDMSVPSLNLNGVRPWELRVFVLNCDDAAWRHILWWFCPLSHEGIRVTRSGSGAWSEKFTFLFI